MPIALDCANGATQFTTPLMLEKLGATVSCIHNGDGVINEKMWFRAYGIPAKFSD